MKKRCLLYLCMAIALTVLCLLALPTWAAAATEGDYTYTVENGQATITGTSSLKGAIVLPSKLGGYPVTALGKRLFYGHSGITSVVIPDSVTEVGEYAFYNCSKLTSITIGKGVTSIGYRAFRYCEELIAVNFNAVNCTEAPGSMFYESSKLTVLNIGDEVTHIPSSAFEYSKALTEVVIPDSVKSIGCYAFASCSALQTVQIGNGVTDISCYAFSRCNNLTKVTLGNQVDSIGPCAFFYCESLTDFTASDSVTTVGRDAFLYTPWISNQPKGLVYVGRAAYLYKGETPETVTIKEGTTCISGRAFSGKSNLVSVSIPDSVTDIGVQAFYNCSNLGDITIPEAVTHIGESAFQHCASLESIHIPGSVVEIGTKEHECERSVSVIINIIGADAVFGFCDNLARITVAEDNAIYYGEGNCIVEKSTNKLVVGCNNSVIPEGVTEIGKNAFTGCDKITEIAIPDSVTAIGIAAFNNCTGLTHITIPESVGIIYGDTFYGCQKLSYVNLPASVTAIYSYGFYKCDSLTDVYYNGTAEEHQAITVHSYNECLTNATWHYDAWCENSAEHSYDDCEDAVCNICGKIRTAAHLYKWVVDRETTCGVDGSKHEECAVCREIRNENTPISATETHRYDNACDDTCNACSQLRTAPHNLEWVVDRDPTCGVDGARHAECKDCGAILYENTAIPATGNHTYAWLVDRMPTCSAEGSKHEECSVCHHKRNENTIISATGKHNYVWLVDRQPDRCLDGIKHEECRVCHYKRNENTVIPATGDHTFDDSTDDECNVCHSAIYSVTLFSTDDTVYQNARVASGRIFALPSNSLSRNGYVFVGWCASNGSDKIYQPGDNVTITQNTTFKAIWSLKCSACGADGKKYKTCSTCNGTGAGEENTEDCTLCVDGKRRKCNACSSTNVTYVALYGYYQCKNCNNINNVSITTCSWCGGTGYYVNGDCDDCGGTGGYNVECSDCSGEGEFFTITWVVDGKITTTQVKWGGVPKYSGSTAKEGDPYYAYTFTGWHKTVQLAFDHAIYVATYSTSVAEYSVVFKDWNDQVLSSGTYHYGDPVEAPADPARQTDEIGVYTFAGWDKEIVNCEGNTVYKATYDVHYFDYTVVFKDWNGDVLSTQTYRWDDPVTAPAAPIRAADHTYTYHFAGWDKAVVACAGDATYTATYESSYIDYTVVFKNWNGDILSSQTYYWGDAVTPPEDPAKAADDTYTYRFTGWDADVVACAGDATYTATYESSYIDYTVVFKDWNGDILSSQTYHWGDAVTPPEDPAKAADDTYTYRFTGWDADVVACAGDATYTATYESSYIDYTVVFKDWNGDILSTQTYHWGDLVTAPADPVRVMDDTYKYIFIGWDKVLANCQGDTIYTAVYEAVEKRNGLMEEDGKWYYYKDDAKLTGWVLDGKTWYYMNAEGVMQTGWLKEGNTWYYLKSSGAMVTGWLQQGSTWYYMNSSGAMATGWCQVGGIWYYFKSSGEMTTGWLQVGSTWYYFKSSGAMVTGWQQVGGVWYYFKSSGAMVTGWQQVGGTWYYFQSSGAMQTGWLKLGSTWYYFHSSGAMATGTVYVSGKNYRFNSSGACLNP